MSQRPAPLIDVGAIRQAGLGTVEPHRDPSTAMHGSYVATVTAVYPVGHPENTWGQTVADVLFNSTLPPWRKVPMGTPYAHGETEKAVPNSRRRQPYDPKPRHQMDGASADVRPGTRVIVTFPDGDLRSPFIAGTLKFNLQGEQAAPVERVGEDRFGDDGHYHMAEVTPLDSSMSEYPRSVDGYNGSRMVRDNRGNVLVQTTTDRDPVFPGHNGIPKAPDPEGNLLLSTRGAKRGRLGRLTGKHPLTGDAGDGTIRDETIDAEKGTWIARLRSRVGRLWFSTRGSGDGRVYIENGARSHVSLREGVATLHAATKAVVDATLVCLGNPDPQYHAMLYEKWLEWTTLLIEIFDSHVHSGVTKGEDNTDKPVVGLRSFWETLFQAGEAIKSDHVKLVKSEAAQPEHEDDPDGNDTTPATTPPAPASSPTPAPKKKKPPSPYGAYIGGR